MPRKKPNGLFSKPEIKGLCKRFLKDCCYDPKMDTITMYKLVKQFPSRDFWLNYNLGFSLNSMFWFLSSEGQSRLRTDWNIFNLDLSKTNSVKMSDKKVGEDFSVKNKPHTIAQFLK